MATRTELWLDGMFNKLDTLSHEYDPVKAHEYYLRTRELKGREGGGGDHESVRTAREAGNAAEARELQVEAERKKLREALKARLEELEELEVRLDQLNTAIKRAKFAAMRRAGNISEETLSRMISAEMKTPGGSKNLPEPEAKSEKSDKSSSSGDEKSAAQKRKDAKAAKERYEEEKAKNPDEALEQLQDKVDETNQRFEQLQKRIEAIRRIGQNGSDKP